MNRHSEIASKIATELDDIVVKMSSLDNIYTDFGGSKVESKNEKMNGNNATITAVLYFDKLFYIASYVGRELIRMYGEEMVRKGFVQVLNDMHQSLIRKLSMQMEKDPPMYRVVGWKEADDYDNVKCRVDKVESSGKVYIKFDEIILAGRVRVTLTAIKLPVLNKGIYDEMSDSELKQLIQAWGNEAPENFWMDGEYQGSAASRIRDLMHQWRAMTPNQQNKHYQDLQKWIHH